MTVQPTTWIALLRAIGAGTHKLMSMAQLREACSDAGFENVRTVLATGNVIFSAPAPTEEITNKIADIILSHGLTNNVFLRRPAELGEVLKRNPFPEAAAQRASQMLVLFLERDADARAAGALGQYQGPEKIKVLGREVYIDYVDGISRSKLTGAVLEKQLGQPGTARNWNTIHKLYANSQH